MTHSGTSYEGIRLSHAAQVVQGLEVLFGAIHLASERCLLGLSTLFALIFSKTHFLSLRIHTATHNHDYTHRIRDCFIFLDQRQVYCWTSIDKLSLDTIYSRYNKYLLYFFFCTRLTVPRTIDTNSGEKRVGFNYASKNDIKDRYLFP